MFSSIKAETVLFLIKASPEHKLMADTVAFRFHTGISTDRTPAAHSPSFPLRINHAFMFTFCNVHYRIQKFTFKLFSMSMGRDCTYVV